MPNIQTCARLKASVCCNLLSLRIRSLKLAPIHSCRNQAFTPSYAANLDGQKGSVRADGLHRLPDCVHDNVGSVNDDEVCAILSHNLLAVF